jgi:hypothetical protein
MTDINYFWCFALCALAVWRVAHLLARESGPWDLIARLRATLGSGAVGSLMGCFDCQSFLISLPATIWMSNSRIGFLVQWLALSAAACLLERVTQRQQSGLRVSPASISYLDKVIRGV